MSAAMGFLLGTPERVRNSHGKRAIGVRAMKILLYLFEKSEVAVERISVCNAIEKLKENGIHCLSCFYTNDVIDLLA